MGNLSIFQTAFSAGELSPKLDARVDVEKYSKGCRTLQNMIVLPYGGVYRRPGLEYLGATKQQDKHARLLPFNFSVSTNYILEVGEKYIRFWSMGQQVLLGVDNTPPAWADATEYKNGDQVDTGGTSYYVCLQDHTSVAADNQPETGTDWADYWYAQAGAILEVPTPYLESELHGIQIEQANDVVYITHPNHWPQKISRYDTDKWGIAKLIIEENKFPPVMDQNTDEDITINPDGTTGTINLVANKDIFKPGHVGSYWQIGHKVEPVTWKEGLDGTSWTDPNDVGWAWVPDDYTLRTSGTWQGTVSLEQRRNEDNATKETVLSRVSSLDANYNFTGSVDERVQMHLLWDSDGSGSGDPPPIGYMQIDGGVMFGAVEILTVAPDGLSATAEVITPLVSQGTTWRWSEGAWSDVQGFPRSICLHEQRMFYGGTKKQPMQIWGSQLGEFDNFELGSNDDDGLSFQVAASQSNPIQWMVSQDRMLIGTSGGEWAIGATLEDTTLSPGNFTVRRYSTYGSQHLKALLINEVVMFVQRQGRKVRELVYALEKNGYVAPDMTLLSEHITEGGITETAYQSQQDSVMWSITGAGTLVGMTYEREQNVVGWHRHTTAGEFEAVATIYGEASDEVWVIVKREVNGQTVRHVERMALGGPQTQGASWTKEQSFYVDSGITQDNGATPSATVTGLDHLEGMEVQVLANGKVQHNKTVSSGSIVLDAPSTGLVTVGLYYESLLRPMRLNLQMQDGPSAGKMLKIDQVIFRVLDTLGMEYQETGEDRWWPVNFRTLQDKMDSSPTLYSGDMRQYFEGSFKIDADYVIRQPDPLPLIILGIIPKFTPFGK